MPNSDVPEARALLDGLAPTQADLVPPLIEAHGLVKRFGAFTAVDAIDFDVAPGEAFGFLGPNGAGKTSTMRMIGCVSPVTGGSLRVLGLDPAIDGPRIRARLGVVPQQDTLDMELTVRENLLIYGRYFDLPARRASARVPASCSTSSSSPSARDDEVEPLSGGMKRRLTIARGADQRARPAAARRADDGPRPAGAPPALGPPLPAQAARRHARPHDPLHGRGGAAVRSAGRHGQGADRGRRVRRASSSSATRPARSRSCASRSGSRRRSAVRSTRLADRVDRLPDRVLVYADDGEAAAAAVHARGLRPESVLVRRSTLEDVFLRLTGRALVD